MSIDTKHLIASLRSDLCPMCGGFKQSAHSMCGKDYRRLPRAMQQNLYNRIGAGYAEAIDAAMKQLGVTTFQVK